MDPPSLLLKSKEVLSFNSLCSCKLGNLHHGKRKNHVSLGHIVFPVLIINKDSLELWGVSGAPYLKALITLISGDLSNPFLNSLLCLASTFHSSMIVITFPFHEKETLFICFKLAMWWFHWSFTGACLIRNSQNHSRFSFSTSFNALSTSSMFFFLCFFKTKLYFSTHKITLIFLLFTVPLLVLLHSFFLYGVLRIGHIIV